MPTSSEFTQATAVVKLANRLSRLFGDPSRREDQVPDVQKRSIIALGDQVDSLLHDDPLLIPTLSRIGQLYNQVGNSPNATLGPMTFDEAMFALATIAEVVAAHFGLREDGGSLASKTPSRGARITVHVDQVDDVNRK